jgi:hypothetical protein
VPTTGPGPKAASSPHAQSCQLGTTSLQGSDSHAVGDRAAVCEHED